MNEKDLMFLKGKTIAIVYTFEGDNSSGLEHFYTWKSNIISRWMIAIQNLSCMPLILDVRTFVDKAMNNTLPTVDYVINLNTGIYELSTMALVPSVCSAIGVSCIPCDAVTITVGENKNLSNHIAKSLGLNVPKTLHPNDNGGIFRPFNLGNSLGVTRNYPSTNEKGIYQEFIPGYEITTPVMFNPVENKMEILPTVVFYPKNNDASWYYGKKDKHNQQGYDFKIIKLDNELQQLYLDLVMNIGVHTFCRIDARIKCSELSTIDNYICSYQEAYFIEINVMPTIRAHNSFNYSFESLKEDSSIIKFKHNLENTLDTNCDLYTLLLASSMISLKTRY